MKYLLDTSAIVHYLKFRNVHSIIDKDIHPFSDANTALISVVTMGELKSLALRNEWNDAKLVQLNNVLSMCTEVPISSKIIDIYAQIDSYSQGQNAEQEFDGEPMKMGKNDLWIAATAASNDAKLISIDKDFSHLSGVFIDLVLLSVRGKYLDPLQYIEPNSDC